MRLFIRVGLIVALAYALPACVSPMASAIQSGNTERVVALIKSGADPSVFQVPLGPQSTVAHAIHDRNPRMLQVLLNHGADIWYLNPPAIINVVMAFYGAYGPTSRGASDKGAIEMSEILLAEARRQQRERDFVNRPNAEKNTALHLIARGGSMNYMRFLLANGANPNAANAVGVTPLHVVGMVGHKNQYQMLIAAGGDTSLRDASGMTPVAYLAEFERKKNEPSFQWGKLAAMGIGAMAGGAAGLDAATQADLFTSMVADSMPGQQGMSNSQGSMRQYVARNAPAASSGAAVATQQPVKNYVFKYTCAPDPEQRSTSWSYRTEACNELRKQYAARAMCNDTQGLGPPPSCE